MWVMVAQAEMGNPVWRSPGDLQTWLRPLWQNDPYDRMTPKQKDGKVCKQVQLTACNLKWGTGALTYVSHRAQNWFGYNPPDRWQIDFMDRELSSFSVLKTPNSIKIIY